MEKFSIRQFYEIAAVVCCEVFCYLRKKIDDIFRKPIAWRNEMKKLDFTHIHFGWQTSYVLDDLHKLKPFTTNTAVFWEAQVPSKQLEYDVWIIADSIFWQFWYILSILQFLLLKYSEQWAHLNRRRKNSEQTMGQCQ